MTVKNTATGSLATVIGQFSILLNEDEHPDEFAKKHGLGVYKRIGHSRLYILEASEDEDIMAIEKSLRASGNVEAVKVELLENIMKPL